MPYEHVILEKDEGIAIITINRPKVLNALRTDVLRDLKEALMECENDSAVSVVIITGAGDRAFVAGADIGEMSELDPVKAKAFSEFGNSVFLYIEKMSKPVIAAINGYALGGGCELLMACDIVIASEKAKIGQPEVKLGIPPGFGGTQRMPRLLGKMKAKELIFTGDMIDAQEALRIGLVNRVVPPEKLMEEARNLAKTIASRGQIAVRMAKQLINEGIDVDLETGLALEAKGFAICFSTEDQKEGMRAFLEKRDAKFTGK
ncbi:MAG: short-chain-enoyl-CoA hydratase [Methanomassiliicoccales archaeon]|jgi:enoyl-CoA hydratase|nr:short-chain-enoyl-CoA hydratase [Methanomassiliicoccales archaeon]